MFSSHTLCKVALHKLSKKKDTQPKVPFVQPPKAPVSIPDNAPKIGDLISKLQTANKRKGSLLTNKKVTIPATKLKLKTQSEKNATVLRKTVKIKELGKVLSVKDGVVRASGLNSVKAGEMVKFVGKSLFGMS